MQCPSLFSTHVQFADLNNMFVRTCRTSSEPGCLPVARQMSLPNVAAATQVGGMKEAIAQCLARYADVLHTRALCAAAYDGSNFR